jgi:hypothetical protein
LPNLLISHLEYFLKYLKFPTYTDYAVLIEGFIVGY